MSKLQAVLFFKGRGTYPEWNVMNSIKWLRKHNIKPLKSPDTKLFENQIRYRITQPKPYKRYTTKILKNNIHLILGWKD